ncbi:hypothetical protein RHMOL_Rhmol03G0091500 [Rhododendron molle]|nr:hypothetical protein RHMOL_Rhmol03G0091500 [Rhododendron molle]
MLGVHIVLNQVHPDVVTIVVPHHPQHGQEIAQKEGVSVALSSSDDKLMPGTNIYVVDTLGELRYFYRLTPIAVVGGSFFPDITGHNISKAAAAGCAVLTGHHVGHLAYMVQEMRQLNPLLVLQETRDTAIKLLRKKIVLPKDGRNPSVSGEDFVSQKCGISLIRRVQRGQEVFPKFLHCVSKMYDGHLMSEEVSSLELVVSGKLELEKALGELFRNSTVLEACRAAGRQAIYALSRGVIENVWNLLHSYVFKKSLC